MSEQHIQEVDTLVVWAWPSFTHAAVMTSWRTRKALSNILVCDPNGISANPFPWKIDANDKLERFLDWVQPEYAEKVRDLITRDDYKALRSTYASMKYVRPLFKRRWATLEDELGDKFIKTKVIEAQQTEDNRYKVLLENGQQVLTKTLLLANWWTRRPSLFKETSFAEKAVSADIFQQDEDLMKSVEKIAVVWSSHSAMSTIKTVKRLNPNCKIDLLYRQKDWKDPTNLRLSDYYKPYFDEVFNWKIQWINLIPINDKQELLSQDFSTHDLIVEATGYQRNKIILKDVEWNNIESKQIANVDANIYDEDGTALPWIFAMWLASPVYGIQPEVLKAKLRVVEGAALPWEVKIVTERIIKYLRTYKKAS